MDSPARRISKESTEVGQSIRAAMALLLEAYVYSQDVARPKWDFAVEIELLRMAGASNSDLRWLLCKDYVEQADEVSVSSGEGRRFRQNGQLALNGATCFVATEAGIGFAEQIGCTGGNTLALVLHPAAVDASSPSSPAISWDPARRELRLGGKIVKRFRVPAPNQELILAAFQEDGWPDRVDDPLPPAQGLDVKQRLHSAICCLNRNQKDRLIRFRGDGNGSGVCWEIAAGAAIVQR